MKRKRLKPVQLSNVPLKERRAAARRLARQTVDPLDQLELMLAAEKPSQRVYYIVEDTETRIIDLLAPSYGEAA